MSTIDNDQTLVQDELATLKARADLLNISYHPSIGVEKLKEKIAAAQAGTSETATETETDTAAAAKADPAAETEGQKRKRLRDEASKLVRINITCMNPAKKDWEGEIFTVGNAGVGTYRKYVPFNTTEGYHVPNIMFQMLKERMCQVFTTTKTKNGVSIRQGKLIREFAIEVLDPLTPEQLQELAQRQAMARSVD